MRERVLSWSRVIVSFLLFFPLMLIYLGAMYVCAVFFFLYFSFFYVCTYLHENVRTDFIFAKRKKINAFHYLGRTEKINVL